MKLEQLLDIIDRKAAWGWMVETYLAGRVSCPGCGAEITGDRALASFRALKRTYCKACGKVFRPTVGTPIHETSWQPEQFVKLVGLQLAGVSSAELSAGCGKSPGCVRDMLERTELHQVRAPGC